MPYQDVYIKGATVSRGQRECASRFRALRPLLARYKRRITVLDLGASEGYFSFRIAAEYDAACVMIDDSQQLESLCEQNALARTILLRHRASIGDLERLAACEHFDVVLALNVLHHFGDWSRALDAVLALGDNTVIETPTPDDTGACGQHAVPGLHRRLSQMNGLLLAETPSHVSPVARPMWLFENEKTQLSRAYIDVPDHVPPCRVTISSDYENKSVWFPTKSERRDWIAGINVRTYQRLGGAYPSSGIVAAMIENHGLPEAYHGDIWPWNFVLDGDAVYLIDGRDGYAIYDDALTFERTIREVRDHE